MKKRILIASELVSAPVGIFFQNSGHELCSDYDPKLDYEFIVDDFLPELTKFPRVQTKKTLPAPCLSQVRAYIDEKVLASEEGKKLLSRYYADFNDFSVVDFYSGQYKNLYTLKIQDYLNIGYFIDTIVVEAYKNKFDHDRIRQYLNEAIPQALKIVEQQDHPVHLDVSFSFADDAFAAQISFNASASAFKNDFETLTKSSATTNFYDLVYFSKRERASFSAAWFKKPELATARAYFFSEVSAKTASSVSLAEIQPAEGPDQTVAYEPKKNASDQSKKLQIARKFGLFIKNYRSKEESPKEAASLQISDIDSYLEKYPRQDALKELDDEIKDFIIKMIKDDALYQGVTDFVQKIADSNLDKHVEEIQRVIGEKSLADIDEILRIKGAGSDAADEATTVSGWKENLDEEEWKVKRSEIVEQIKEEVTVIKSQGRNVVEDDILRVMSDQLQAKSEEMQSVVKGIIEEAVTAELMQKREKLEEAFARNFMTAKTTPANDVAKEKLEQQIVRMKKLMEQMKNEILKLKTEKTSETKINAVELSSANNGEVIELKRALDRALDQMRNKEKIADKLKADMESIVQAKNDKIASLEMRIENIKQDFAQSAEFANEEKIEKLQVENKSLLARLELANRKINIISENMDRQDSDSNLKKDKEIITLKNNMQSSLSLIEKMKSEKSDLEKQLRDEREKVAKLRDEKSADGKDKAMEQEILIASLTSDKRSLEDKLKLQAIELKKLEQKMKYTTVQLEEAHKKKGSAAGGPKSNEAYIKQLELANSRLAEASNDLTERKKEIHKLKQENALSNAKIAELEKKLANAEKKAA